MDVLQNLTDSQRDLITVLPYRAGLFISQSDDTGGDEADEKELRALENIIHGFAGEVFGSELVQHIMAETLKRQDQWGAWAERIEMVPQECEQAVSALRMYVDEKDVKAYVARLMEIGEAVALAFREVDELASFKDKMLLRFEYWQLQRKARRNKTPVKSFDQFLQISMHERQALWALAKALGAKY